MRDHAPSSSATEPTRASVARPEVRGKFIFVGEEKFLLKGASYGAFRPNEVKEEYWDQEQIDRDFRQMAATGFNTVRIPHTMPPVSLLDAAWRHGLRVMVGLSAEQYVGYLIDTKKKGPDVPALVRAKVRAVAGHPALLCYAIGNEISAATARWLGARKIERYLHRIHRAIKAEDPAGIVTYVNYPSTEYLRLPFLDLLSFNVYLEKQDRLQAYLARLQSLAGERPLLMSEVGLDALRNGEEKQAEVVAWQLATIFAAGCAGVVIFSWTDEWHRAGAEVDDWAFGLTDRARRPKPALAAATRAFAQLPFAPEISWPRITVVVCTYNGSRTLEECLAAVTSLTYPNFNVIVVDDGSTDSSAAIAASFPCRVLTTSNRGLSAARTLGAGVADGEIVAYLDDDAAPDPHWLHFLAHAFLTTDHAAIGGPNLLPPRHGFVERCIDKAPGGAQQVLLTDELAEHIPGCNCAVRRACLEAINGFDPIFRAAGDDVDFCWRLQERGWTIGFAPGAVVWHHRRRSVREFFRQQVGYGKAESLLEKKWPERFNVLGHQTFHGRMYGGRAVHALFRSFAIYHGSGGFAPFQSLYERSSSFWGSLPLMPEWYLLVASLGAASLLGAMWPPLLWALPLAGVAIVLSLVHAVKEARDFTFTGPRISRGRAFAARWLVGFLHLAQPCARLWGRLCGGLTAWRHRSSAPFHAPWPREEARWTGDWREPAARLADIRRSLAADGQHVATGGDFDRWDLEVVAGAFGGARLLMAVEDHGAGTQYVRRRVVPRVRASAVLVLGVTLPLGLATAVAHAWIASAAFGLLAAWVLIHTWRQSGSATGALLKAAEAAEVRPQPSVDQTQVDGHPDGLIPAK
jgi:O-antigen biosynthesis protein